MIPGTIQAEEYDLGGEGVGYSDTDAGNIGGVGGPCSDDSAANVFKCVRLMCKK